MKMAKASGPDDDMEYLIAVAEEEGLPFYLAPEGDIELQTTDAILKIKPDHTWEIRRF